MFGYVWFICCCFLCLVVMLVVLGCLRFLFDSCSVVAWFGRWCDYCLDAVVLFFLLGLWLLVVFVL